MPEINFPDPSGSPFTDPAGKIWEHDGDGWRVQGIEAIAPTSTGFKNVIINGRLGPNHIYLESMPWLINQRGFDGDWSPTGYYFGFDGWRTYGQGAVDIAQYITPADFVDGATYTLNAKAPDGFVAEITGFNSSGEGTQIALGTLPLTFIMNIGAAKVIVVQLAKTAYDIQLELGAVPTAFEIRPVGLELELCKRYGQELVWSPNINTVFAPLGYGRSLNASDVSVDIPLTTTLRLDSMDNIALNFSGIFEVQAIDASHSGIVNDIILSNVSPQMLRVRMNTAATNLVPGTMYVVTGKADARLFINNEL